MFKIRISTAEETEMAIRQYVRQCLVEWDTDVKWEVFVDFER